MGGCCGCGKWLKIVFGALLILSSVTGFNPWMVLGLYIALKGLLPMLCKCDGCMVEGKKKK